MSFCKCKDVVKLFLPADSPACPELGKGEACHRHEVVPTGMKYLAGLAGPLLAILWTVITSGSSIFARIKDAEEKTGYGIDIALCCLILIALMSFFWTVHSKCTTVQGYFTMGLAVPFSIFSIIHPSVGAMI